MPLAAKKFNRLELRDQLKQLEGKIPTFYQPTTVYIILPEMAIVAEYSAHLGAEMKATNISAMSTEQGLFRLKNIPGRRCLWHHLDPTPRLINYLNKKQNEKTTTKAASAGKKAR